jgi:hypothetical protein
VPIAEVRSDGWWKSTATVDHSCAIGSTRQKQTSSVRLTVFWPTRGGTRTDTLANGPSLNTFRAASFSSLAPSAKELPKLLIYAFRLFLLGEVSALRDGDAAYVARQPLPDLQDVEGFADEFEVGAP